MFWVRLTTHLTPYHHKHILTYDHQIALYTFPALWVVLLIVSFLKFNLSCAYFPLLSTQHGRHIDPRPCNQLRPHCYPRSRLQYDERHRIHIRVCTLSLSASFFSHVHLSIPMIATATQDNVGLPMLAAGVWAWVASEGSY